MGKVSFVAKGKRISFTAGKGRKKKSKGKGRGSFLVRFRVKSPVLFLREDGSWTREKSKAWHFPTRAAAEGGKESFSYDDAIVVKA